MVHYLTPQVHGRVLVERMGSHRMFVLESICAVLKWHSMLQRLSLPLLKDVPNLAINLAGPSAKGNEALVPQACI